MIGLRVGKVVLPGEIHREPSEAVVEVERRLNEAGGAEQSRIESSSWMGVTVTTQNGRGARDE